MSVDTITAKKREKTGSRASHKLRLEGLVPAVLYGHKEAPETLSLPAKTLRKALAHKARVIKLEGDASGQAVIQELQWDVFHRHLLHIDLLRVSKGEKVQISVLVVTKGEPAGAENDGVLTLVNDHVDVEAAPMYLPETLTVDVSSLQIGDHLTASDIIDLSPEATLMSDPDMVIAQCVPPAREPDLDSVAEEGGDPEVIGGGDEAEEGEKAEGEAETKDD